MKRTTMPRRIFVLPALTLASLALAGCSVTGAKSEVGDPVKPRAETPTYHADPPCAAGQHCLR